MDKFDALEKAMCKELEALEHKIQGGAEMSVQDLEKIDKLTHVMKSLATYTAMKEAEEFDGYSGYRGRASNGRYVSRDGAQSYADGYSQGYSEAMRMSGHYPMGPWPDRR